MNGWRPDAKLVILQHSLACLKDKWNLEWFAETPYISRAVDTGTLDKLQGCVRAPDNWKNVFFRAPDRSDYFVR